MRRLTVVAPAFYPNPRQCHFLMDSCANLGLSYYLFGLGEQWPGAIEAKIIRLLWEIERLETEYVLMTDAGDSFVMADEDELLARTPAAPPVVSAEKNCWPQPQLAEYYPGSVSPWRYVNSGGYIGTKEGVAGMLRAMHASLPSDDQGDDQFALSLAYLNGYPLILDTLCQVFQTAAGAGQDEFSWQGNRLRNNVTGSTPCVLHFNGHTPGIDKTFERRFSACVVLKAT